MENSIAEKVIALEIEYGKWARENLLRQDNSIIAFVYSVKMGRKIYEYDHSENMNGVQVDFRPTTQEEMYNCIRDWTHLNPKDAYWFIPVNMWWTVVSPRTKEHPLLVPTDKLLVGHGAMGLVFTEGRKVCKSYGHDVKTLKLTKQTFTARLANKAVYDVHVQANNPFRPQSLREALFSIFCSNVEKGMELFYKGITGE